MFFFFQKNLLRNRIKIGSTQRNESIPRRLFSPWQLRQICWADAMGTEVPILFSNPSLLAAKPTSSDSLETSQVASQISPKLLPNRLFIYRPFSTWSRRLLTSGFRRGPALTAPYLPHSPTEGHPWSLENLFLLLS